MVDQYVFGTMLHQMERYFLLRGRNLAMKEAALTAALHAKVAEEDNPDSLVALQLRQLSNVYQITADAYWDEAEALQSKYYETVVKLMQELQIPNVPSMSTEEHAPNILRDNERGRPQGVSVAGWNRD